MPPESGVQMLNFDLIRDHSDLIGDSRFQSSWSSSQWAGSNLLDRIVRGLYFWIINFGNSIGQLWRLTSSVMNNVGSCLQTVCGKWQVVLWARCQVEHWGKVEKWKWQMTYSHICNWTWHTQALFKSWHLIVASVCTNWWEGATSFTVKAKGSSSTRPWPTFSFLDLTFSDFNKINIYTMRPSRNNIRAIGHQASQVPQLTFTEDKHLAFWEDTVKSPEFPSNTKLYIQL